MEHYWRLSPPGNASLLVQTPDGSLWTFRGLNLPQIGEKCPLLALAFEESFTGNPTASINASSAITVEKFLRFLYLGDYTVYDNTNSHITPSLLLHAELYKMAIDFDVPELEVLTHLSLTEATEMSCSLPSPPVDLVDTIQFVYDKLPERRPIKDMILHYCVGCFHYHKLATNEQFKTLAYELRPFHLDLCHTNILRGFEDDGAQQIVQLPDCKADPMSSIGKRATDDVIFDLWADAPEPSRDLLHPKDEAEYPPLAQPQALAYRPRPARSHNTEGWEDIGMFSDTDASASETEGFTLVRRPKGRASRIDGFGVAQEEEYCSSGAPQPAPVRILDMPEMIQPPATPSEEDETLGSSVITIRPYQSQQQPGKTPTASVADDDDSDSDWVDVLRVNS